MAPSRLHAIYGGGSLIHHEEEEFAIPPENSPEESKVDNLSDSPEESEILPNKSESQDQEIIIPSSDGGDSKTNKEEESVILHEEEYVNPMEKEEPEVLPNKSEIQNPEIIDPLVDGGDSKSNKEEPEIITENLSDSPEDSPLNEVDRLFANLTGGSTNNNTNSSDYIYKLIEPEDLRLWLYDEQLQMSNDVSGGAENDDQSNNSHMRSSPYYSEFQALIDGLI
ncbi:MAG: hypothetical protein IKA36_06170 [Clostridia bacterium]|nr:hypothetical protein [Clostridia bacterium]